MISSLPLTVIQKGKDPILKETAPGLYTSSGNTVYEPGKCQLSRSYKSNSNSVSFRILYPESVKAIEFTGLTKDIKFFATSQTMELIVPMARKHVAVTNVFKGDASAQDGNSDCKSKLTAANSGEKMNVVLDGNERVIELNGLASGYVYEIAYSALDFHGKIAARKYYIKIK